MYKAQKSSKYKDDLLKTLIGIFQMNAMQIISDVAVYIGLV